MLNLQHHIFDQSTNLVNHASLKVGTDIMICQQPQGTRVVDAYKQ